MHKKLKLPTAYIENFFTLLKKMRFDVLEMKPFPADWETSLDLAPHGYAEFTRPLDCRAFRVSVGAFKAESEEPRFRIAMHDTGMMHHDESHSMDKYLVFGCTIKRADLDRQISVAFQRVVSLAMALAPIPDKSDAYYVTLRDEQRAESKVINDFLLNPSTEETVAVQPGPNLWDGVLYGATMVTRKAFPNELIRVTVRKALDSGTYSVTACDVETPETMEHGTVDSVGRIKTGFAKWDNIHKDDLEANLKAIRGALIHGIESTRHNSDA